MQQCIFSSIYLEVLLKTDSAVLNIYDQSQITHYLYFSCENYLPDRIIAMCFTGF